MSQSQRKKVKAAPLPDRDHEFMSVRSDALVVRYNLLSRTLPHGQRQQFWLGTERPALLIERHGAETWFEACTRTHQQVLHLVQMQVNDLQQAQRAAVQLLQPASADASSEQELTELTAQLAAPLHGDEIGLKAHQDCLKMLGQYQTEDIVAGCKNGGYAQVVFDCLTQTSTGHYLNGVLVSSAAYLEEQCYQQQSSEQAQNESIVHYSYQKVGGQNVAGKLALGDAAGFTPLPIWAASKELPPPIDDDLESYRESFTWRAHSYSRVCAAIGGSTDWVSYDNGLCQGTFAQFHADSETSEQGTCSAGQLPASLRLTMYQDYRARFPAATFTVDLAQGTFIGPYQKVFSIDELFNQGYHAVLLEVYDSIVTDQGTKQFKRIKTYQPGTYVQEEGNILANGKIEVTERYRLNKYKNPYRPRYYYKYWW